MDNGPPRNQQHPFLLQEQTNRPNADTQPQARRSDAGFEYGHFSSSCRMNWLARVEAELNGQVCQFPGLGQQWQLKSVALLGEHPRCVLSAPEWESAPNGCSTLVLVWQVAMQEVSSVQRGHRGLRTPYYQQSQSQEMFALDWSSVSGWYHISLDQRGSWKLQGHPVEVWVCSGHAIRYGVRLDFSVWHPMGTRLQNNRSTAPG